MKFKNILVVVKQTPYEQYMQKKVQGKAPVALRWERLKNRYENHRECVDKVVSILKHIGTSCSVIGREEMHRGCLLDKDLLISIGGDGTVLNASSFLDDSIPVLGINSDPTRPEEQGVKKKRDERRSRGALCAATATNADKVLPLIISGGIEPGKRTRIQCIVRGTYNETRLPPALNDILIANPSPAAVSRFNLTLANGVITPSFQPNEKFDEIFSFNVWSSGIWISTATGSTAAMHAAGGQKMDYRSENLQYMVREHLLEQGQEDMKGNGHKIFDSTKMLSIRWNSQKGSVFVDGSHLEYDLELGDEMKIDGHAPCLNVFDPPEI